MIVLDTNVLSELMQAATVPPVRRWLMGIDPKSLFTTSICEAEILVGIAVLPAGRRRSAIEVAAYRMFTEDLDGRVLLFDSEAARNYAEIVAFRRRQGAPIQPMDGMIAAIARANDASVATRNIKDFEGCGIVLHDPWREL